MKILVAEDERPLAKIIVKLLEKNNYSADAVYNGADALKWINANDYDAMVCDIMMPQMDGLTVVRKLRESGNSIPVLILTAKSEVGDMVKGLDSGADYYLTKPFNIDSLLAAIRAVTRHPNEVDARLHYGNVSLDRTSFELSCGSESVRLGNKEYQIMEMLMSDPHRIFPSEHILDQIWGYDHETNVNVVWVYISKLRKKLNSLGANIKIRAARNLGYSLEISDDQTTED